MMYVYDNGLIDLWIFINMIVLSISLVCIYKLYKIEIIGLKFGGFGELLCCFHQNLLQKSSIHTYNSG